MQEQEHAIDPVDEGRHEAGSERFWSESYYFDFHRDDGSLGGYVRVGICANLGVTWYWACLVGAERPLVTVIDHAVPLPAPESLDLHHRDLTATHRFGWNTEGATPTLTKEQRETHPDVVHPIVRRHPKTGRKILYVNPGYVMRINDVSASESDELLEELFEHALRPEYQYRHKWGLNMLLGLDNRASMHAAVDDYNEPRRMLRMIVGNTEKNGMAA